MGLKYDVVKCLKKCANLGEVSEIPTSLIHTVGFTAWSFVYVIESFTPLKVVQMKLVQGFLSNKRPLQVVRMGVEAGIH